MANPPRSPDPNHVHLLLTLPGEISREKTVQLVKGNFSDQSPVKAGLADSPDRFPFPFASLKARNFEAQ